MHTKDFLRLGVPLGQATRRATDFISKFILGGGDKSRLHEEVAAGQCGNFPVLYSTSTVITPRIFVSRR